MCIAGEFTRTGLLLGEVAMEKLKSSRVAVFGIGGVGGHTCDALVRSGVGTLAFFDNDTVSTSNLNRQLVATHSTIGKSKVEVMRAKALDINPNADIAVYHMFFTPENSDQVDFTRFDYVVDAIDTVTAKIALIQCANAAGVPIISAMGAGNKLDPTAFQVADITKTKVCPLARIMRKKLKEVGITHLKVVYSEEIPLTPADSLETKGTAGRPAPGSIAFVPAVVGLILAGEVIKDLIKI